MAAYWLPLSGHLAIGCHHLATSGPSWLLPGWPHCLAPMWLLFGCCMAGCHLLAYWAPTLGCFWLQTGCLMAGRPWLPPAASGWLLAITRPPPGCLVATTCTSHLAARPRLAPPRTPGVKSAVSCEGACLRLYCFLHCEKRVTGPGLVDNAYAETELPIGWEPHGGIIAAWLPPTGHLLAASRPLPAAYWLATACPPLSGSQPRASKRQPRGGQPGSQPRGSQVAPKRPPAKSPAAAPRAA